MSKKTGFTPPWYAEPTPEGSFRSLFKWADLAELKHPNNGLVEYLIEKFDLNQAHFAAPLNLSLEQVPDDQPCSLAPEHLEFLRQTCSPENLRTDTYERAAKSYGAGMLDALRLRRKMLENLPEAVVAPRTQEEIEAIVRYADEKRIPIYVFGGGSTVTRGFEATRQGSIALDMSKHMKRVVSFNETDQTIEVEAGIWGPELEAFLQNAPEQFGAKRAYTLGHFPQSFKASSVGGWIVTRGAGQNSTYYGKIEDMVISQEYVTPRGILRTCTHPRSATGPDFDEIMMGSEGSFGILTKATFRVCRWMPQNRRKFSYMFKNWQDAQDACREVMQAEIGFPSVFRISDPEETDVMMHQYHIADTPADMALKALGFQPMQKCLMLGFTDGELGFSINLDRKIRQIMGKYKAFDLRLAKVTETWERGRFTDPHLREDLMDYGILIDTLECGVTWSQMPRVHAEVRKVIKARPRTICMTHISHCYPQGGNLYFIIVAKMDTMREYLDLQYDILEAIARSGASVSHHHGVGKQSAPWLEDQIGAEQMELIRVLKKHFDPHNIMNPGGTLGLDMSPDQQAKRWSKDLEG